MREGRISGIREIRSLNIRVARDIPGIAQGIPLAENLLIIGAPGWGKTTLLRDLIRSISENGAQIAVVDERMELFPPGGFSPGPCTDILSGCGKEEGIHTVLRAMGPEWIGVDEITHRDDCEALLEAGWCGVRLIATAHAASIWDLQRRKVYQPLISSGLFSTVVVLKPDQQWTLERMDL